MFPCTKCGQVLPRESFRPNPRLRSGVNSWCKPCSLAATRQWRERNRAAINEARRRPRLEARTCYCGVTFAPVAVTQTYCSVLCRNRRPTKPRESWATRRNRAEGKAPKRTCSQCGAEFAVVAKLREQFCSKACAALARGAQIRCEWRCTLVRWECEECKAPSVGRRPKRFCSDRCQSRWWGRERYVPTPARKKTCRMCGKAFSRQGRGSQANTCSKKCQGRWERSRPAEIAKRRIKRAEREAFVAAGEQFANWEIYVRDNWTCHICGKKVMKGKRAPFHPLAPTIDHLIPVNGHERGPHTRRNVRTAHFICNVKRREVGPAQLILFGEIAA